MTLVKFDETVVTVIGREQNHFMVLTREREVKRIPATNILAVSDVDIKKSLKEIRNNKVVYLPEYRKFKKYQCN
ncbi:hypothetical protein EKG37_21215 [Robertmurraya yapensis]|uniref:Uncharacterized protein n=1 Tax=Bacillus yapensis TaxID=2492960 RepID=A0A3S0JQ05_9BACI|nr:hypothetical protein [Bacillus yapensis]RTR26591.1 hypothetical protein EKG37_21215 [Bacillus yapensis]TKS93766.1 hypothetical protein FAR12_21220 [Bacillus yapensis]